MCTDTLTRMICLFGLNLFLPRLCWCLVCGLSPSLPVTGERLFFIVSSTITFSQRLITQPGNTQASCHDIYLLFALSLLLCHAWCVVCLSPLPSLVMLGFVISVRHLQLWWILDPPSAIENLVMLTYVYTGLSLSLTSAAQLRAATQTTQTSYFSHCGIFETLVLNPNARPQARKSKYVF